MSMPFFIIKTRAIEFMITIYMYVPLEFTLWEWYMFAEIALDCTSRDQDMLVSDINAPLMTKRILKNGDASLSSGKFLEDGWSFYIGVYLNYFIQIIAISLQYLPVYI